MALIVRQLDITKTYKIIGTRYQKDNPTTCDNCNKIITNVVILEDAEGNVYNIGTECAKTINQFMNTWEGIRALKQAEKDLKTVAKFHNWIKKQYASHDTYTLDGVEYYKLFDDNNKLVYRCKAEYLTENNLLKFIK